MRLVVSTVSMRRLAGIGFWAGVVLIAPAVVVLPRHIAVIGLDAVAFYRSFWRSGVGDSGRPLLQRSALATIFARSGTAQLAEGQPDAPAVARAITASTMLIGVAILIMVASIISSVTVGFNQVMRRSPGSDYIFVPPSIAAWGPTSAPGPGFGWLAARRRWRGGRQFVGFAPSQINGSAISLLGIDPATYPALPAA